MALRESGAVALDRIDSSPDTRVRSRGMPAIEPMNSTTPQTVNRGAAAERSRRLSENYRRWSRRPRVQHVACILILALVPLLRWWPALSGGAEPLGDEPAYQAAFARVAAGESPYGGTGFVYPAAFAFAGAWCVEHLGLDATMHLLRGANLLGLATVVWCSMAWLAWSILRRLWVGAAFILLAPQIAHSILLGNVSLAVAGLVVASLLRVPRAPLSAGLALGASIALKPIAPMTVACLIGASHEEARRSRWLAAAAATLVALILISAFPYPGQLIDLQATERVSTTVSLHRLPKLFGLEINALWISGPLALAALALLRRLKLGPARFLCFATTASLVVLPLVWSHTLVLALPLQVLALSVTVDRLHGLSRTKGPAGSLPRWLEPALVLLAVASLQLSAGAGVIDDQNLTIQLAGAMLPALAPIGLLAYLLAHTERF